MPSMGERRSNRKWSISQMMSRSHARDVGWDWPARKCKGGTDGSLFQICSVLAHVSPERASGRPAKGNALDRDGHEKVVFRANGPTTRLRRPVGPLGRENHPLAFRLPGRCPSLGDGLGLRPARALQFHAEQNCSACSSIQGPIFREFCAGQAGTSERRPTIIGWKVNVSRCSVKMMVLPAPGSSARRKRSGCRGSISS